MLPVQQCTGCEACANYCHNNAIKMEQDKDGFLYPKIDPGKCLHCGLCEKRCPVNREKVNKKEIAFYAARYTDAEKLRSVSSGGMASYLYEKCIEDSWVVYGVVWNQDFSGAHYERADSRSKISDFSGTKYIQAQKGNIYTAVKKDLQDRQKVLFIGLPCEIGGLIAYLGIEYENLLTVQLVCHGVTSAKYMDEYCRFLERRFSSKIDYLTLRDKKNGVDPKYIKAHFQNGKEFSEQLLVSDFGTAFVKCDRESCYSCAFKGDVREGDLTIGDYWGLSETNEAWSAMGTSLVVSHTHKGDNFIKELKLDKFCLYKGPEETARLGNPKMYKCGIQDNNRRTIMNAIEKYGLHEGIKKTRTYKDYLKYFYYCFLPSWAKKLVTRIMK